MADPTTDFFEGLSRRGHEPLLEKVTGTVRFDITHGKRTEHRLVAIKKGDVQVSTDNGSADCVIGADRTLLNAIVQGEVNGVAALLRGTLAVEGDPQLLTVFQRIFPGPKSTRAEQPGAGGTG